MRRMLDEKDITKLYIHQINDGKTGYVFRLINGKKEPYNFSNLDTYEKFYQQAILNDKAVLFVDTEYYSLIMYNPEEGCFWSIYSGDDGVNTSQYDDWALASTTDTVSAL